MCSEGIYGRNEMNRHKEEENVKVYQEVVYDDILSAVGEFGRYQMFLFFAMLPFHFFGVFVFFSQMFITEVSPNYWCWVPELENLTEIERRNLAIPLNDKSRFGYSHCSVYIANWTDVLLTGSKTDRSWHTQPCQNGWEFNKTEIPYPTISSEMEWVCEKDSYQASAQAIFFIGSTVGGCFIGWIADRFGRLPGIVVANTLGCVGGITSAFARNFAEFAICRFFTGMACDNCMMLMYLLVLEYIAPRYRSLMANASFGLFYGVAVTSLPWIALACGHWKIICIVTSAPIAFGLLTPFVIPESPKWLLSKGRTDEAIAKALMIGRVNKKEIPPKLIEQFKRTTDTKKTEDNSNILQIFKRPVITKLCICITLLYVTCATVFDVLVRSIGTLDFDFFVSFSVISFTELPSLLLIAFFMDWVGRRLLVTVTLTIGCLFCVLPIFIGGRLPSVLCAVIARFAVNMAFGTATQWVAEMLPTPIRGTGSSVIHILGNLTSVLSPYIIYLEKYVYWLPLAIAGCLAVFGALLAFTLPETARKEMPQTFEDAEEFMRNRKLWEISFGTKNVSKGHENSGYEM